MEDDKKLESTEIPAGQEWFDKIFLWFILSIVLSGILYNVWGMIELLSISPAP